MIMTKYRYFYVDVKLFNKNLMFLKIILYFH